MATCEAVAAPYREHANRFIEEKAKPVLAKADQSLKFAEETDLPSSDPQWQERVISASDTIRKAKVLKKRWHDWKIEAKRPHRERADAIEASFKPVDAVLTGVITRYQNFLSKHHALGIAEQNAQRQEAAAQARKLQASAKASEAVANDPAVPVAQRHEAAAQASQDNAQAQVEQSVARQEVQETMTIRTGETTTTLKRQVRGVKVGDMAEFLRWIVAQNDPDALDFVKIHATAIKSYVNRNKIPSIPGLVFEDYTATRTRTASKEQNDESDAPADAAPSA